MGCGQKAWADEQEEKNQEAFEKRCVKRVLDFDNLTLGILLHDLEAYIKCELNKENTRYGFKNLERLVKRLRNEEE